MYLATKKTLGILTFAIHIMLEVGDETWGEETDAGSTIQDFVSSHSIVMLPLHDKNSGIHLPCAEAFSCPAAGEQSVKNRTAFLHARVQSQW